MGTKKLLNHLNNFIGDSPRSQKRSGSAPLSYFRNRHRFRQNSDALRRKQFFNEYKPASDGICKSSSAFIASVLSRTTPPLAAKRVGRKRRSKGIDSPNNIAVSAYDPLNDGLFYDYRNSPIKQTDLRILQIGRLLSFGNVVPFLHGYYTGLCAPSVSYELAVCSYCILFLFKDILPYAK